MKYRALKQLAALAFLFAGIAVILYGLCKYIAYGIATNSDVMGASFGFVFAAAVVLTFAWRWLVGWLFGVGGDEQ